MAFLSGWPRPLIVATINCVETLKGEGVKVDYVEAARCAFADRKLHSRMPLDPTHVRLKLLHACDQWHSSRVFAPLTGLHCKLRPNTEGNGHTGCNPNPNPNPNPNHQFCPNTAGAFVQTGCSARACKGAVEPGRYARCPRFDHGFCCVRVRTIGLRLLYGARFHHGFCCVRVGTIGFCCTVRVFRQKFTLEECHLSFTPLLLRLKLLQACDQWHASRVSTPLTSSHCKLRPNTGGNSHTGCNPNPNRQFCPNAEGTTTAPPYHRAALTMNSSTILMASHNTEGTTTAEGWGKIMRKQPRGTSWLQHKASPPHSRISVQCTVRIFGRNLHSRMPLDPTPARLKRADV
jgi:hypothetical protein